MLHHRSYVDSASVLPKYDLRKQELEEYPFLQSDLFYFIIQSNLEKFYLVTSPFILPISLLTSLSENRSCLFCM
jgi:hypothetical protein